MAAETFFRMEYKMNRRVGTNATPQVSLWNGIVMGGGVGASVHGAARVATDTTMFAMPETAIGLFPDVGGSRWLPRLPQGPAVGLFLGLTGARMSAGDLLAFGVATHYCPAEQLPQLEAALIDAADAAPQGDLAAAAAFVDDAITAAGAGGAEPPVSKLEPVLPYIEEFFGSAFATGQAASAAGPGHAGVEGLKSLLENLEAAAAGSSDKAEWAAKTLKTLGRMSPTALAVTTEQLVNGLELPSIDECLQMEFRLALRCATPDGDFFEGVRALLMDKDNSPTWNAAPAASDVAAYFAPLGESVSELTFDA
mmetsp:Transcript_39229/g.122752  ORF Transcript_39229/g.122752 Transcript_39229/m.122752 type:complete len:310 (-) Transcript_39229:127-1056(-)